MANKGDDIKAELYFTREYNRFVLLESNRPTTDGDRGHKSLHESMDQHGFIRGFPIICIRLKGGLLGIRDGQHRFSYAQLKDTGVWYVIDDTQFDIGKINGTHTKWKPLDHARRYIREEKAEYIKVMRFATDNELPIGHSFAIMAGVSHFRSVNAEFETGDYQTTKFGEKWAKAVAELYGPLKTMSKKLATSKFVDACMAVCRVPEFEVQRLIKNATRCTEKLTSMSTRDAYLSMMEELYNRGKHNERFGLKAAALNAVKGYEGGAGNARKAA